MVIESAFRALSRLHGRTGNDLMMYIAMTETLEILFGSKTKARLLRFFLLNPDAEFAMSELARRNMVPLIQVRKEINALKKINFITEKTKRREKYYMLDGQFAFLEELRSLVAKSNAYPQRRNLARLKAVGDTKLVLISGIFLNYPKSKADMILVVNNVSRSKLRSVIGVLEAEIGKEISFLLMNSEEFKYRMDMLDRFLLDFFEGPHEEIINKIPGFKRHMASVRKY